jgi:hypothetical protein
MKDNLDTGAHGPARRHHARYHLRPPPGDVGNPESWCSRCCYNRERNERVHRRWGRRRWPARCFSAAGDAPKSHGVIGITVSCGFLTLRRQELMARMPLPIAKSNLTQLPPIKAGSRQACEPAVVQGYLDGWERSSVFNSGQATIVDCVFKRDSSAISMCSWFVNGTGRLSRNYSAKRRQDGWIRVSRSMNSSAAERPGPRGRGVKTWAERLYDQSLAFGPP